MKLLHEQDMKWWLLLQGGYLEVTETPLPLSCNNPKHSGGLSGSSAHLKYCCRGARVLRALTGFDGPQQPFWSFYSHFLPVGLGPPFQLRAGLQPCDGRFSLLPGKRIWNTKDGQPEAQKWQRKHQKALLLSDTNHLNAGGYWKDDTADQADLHESGLVRVRNPVSSSGTKR